LNAKKKIGPFWAIWT